MRALSPDDLTAWGDVELVERATGGYTNEVWYARVGSETCVVRATTRPAASLAWELDLLAELRAVNAAVPEVVPTRDGRSHVAGVVVFRHVDGARPTTDAHWALAHAQLRIAHELGARAQRPGFVAAVDLLTQERGGSIDLGAMPDAAVARCRAAWARLVDLPRTVIHGDPGADNVFVLADGSVVLIDWDEARVDVPLFDLAALPDVVCPLADEERWVARQAASAWEAALAWQSDRSYAEWRLSQVGT